MQRISDLIWMGQGLAKVGKASAGLMFKDVSHFTKTSSIAGPALNKLNEVCDSLSGGLPLNDQFENVMEMEFDFPDDAVDNEIIAKYDVPDSKLQNESGEGNFTSQPNHTQPSRKYSTMTHSHGYSSLATTRLSKYRTYSSNIFGSGQIKKFHHSAYSSAISAAELAMLAKVRRARETKHNFQTDENLKNVQYMQDRLSANSRERKVPATRLGRLASFGGLAAKLAVGSLSQVTKSSIGLTNSDGKETTTSAVLNEANVNMIVDTLCRMRGAALKLGQMLSIQDENIVDPQLLKIFERVRQSADFMPVAQMEKVLVKEFGSNWRTLVKEFDSKPFAAASIGQVHRAVLHGGSEVAMKIQYPGVAEGINSDIDNLVTLLKLWKIFPEQMYVDQFIAVARKELAHECNYQREAEFSEKFREALGEEEIYGVPRIVKELSGKRVLTSELVSGIPIDQVQHLGQDERNFVGAALLRLVLRELFELRLMQTDPNWANFFYNEQQGKLWLLDFGASRTYSKQFVDLYVEVVKAAADGDRAKIVELSRQLGFLTGYETETLNEAHTDAIMILGEPFACSGTFDFSRQSTSRRVVHIVPTLIKHRLTAPPEESYSLHRKLSGAFLICAKLRADFACKPMFDQIYADYHAPR